MKSALTALNQRECEILTKRKLIDDPLTLEELSNEYNVSRERIRQIEVRAFEKLQKKMFVGTESSCIIQIILSNSSIKLLTTLILCFQKFFLVISKLRGLSSSL